MTSVAAPVPGCESCAYTSGERRAPGGRVYENEYWLVEHVGSPWVTGTMVVKTKVHRAAARGIQPRQGSAGRRQGPRLPCSTLAPAAGAGRRSR